MDVILSWLSPLLADVETRAEQAALLLALAVIAGQCFSLELGVFERLAAFGSRKLDRAKRGIATRVYRGMLIAIFLTALAFIFGLAVMHIPWLAELILLLLLMQAIADSGSYRTWRRAHRGQLPLELAHTDFLFADSHAVIRYSILTGGEAFAIGVVGTCFWYVVGGLGPALAYSMLAALAQASRSFAFGWAARGLFRLLNAVPLVLSFLLLTLGALFVPGTHPLATIKARNYQGFIAYLLGVSLGGTLPGREVAWAGTGTPKPTAEHLARWLLLRLAGCVLLVLLLLTAYIVKLLFLLS